MRIRFYGGKLCTMEHGVHLTDEELWTCDGKVEYVGPGRTDGGQDRKSVV